MKPFRSLFLLMLLLTFAAGCAMPPQKSELTAADPVVAKPVTESIRIAGSGSNIPVTQALLDQYGQKSGIHIQIPNSIGTAGAVKALQAGELDLGLISRPLKDSEKESGIKQILYGRIGIVLGVHPGVPDDNIQMADLIKVYAGKKTSWSNGENIIVLIREEGDSSNNVLEDKIPGFKEVLLDALKLQKWEILFTDGEANDAIKNTENSIGLTDTAAIVAYKDLIKPLNLNGVAPALENINNQTYPLYKDLYFAYKEPVTVQTQRFLEFVFSVDGQNVINSSGGIPLKGE